MKEKSRPRLKIEKLVYGGLGLGRLDGRTVLVRYSAPGETVEVELLKEKRDYAEGVALKVIEPSPFRREPPCPYYGVCGGCQLQHLAYHAQLDAKRAILLESLERIGKLKDVPYEGEIPSGQEFHYRVRVQFKVKDGKIGFYRWDSKEVVDVNECLLAHRKINELIPALREINKALKDLQEVHVTYSPSADETVLKLYTITYADEKLVESLKESVLPKSVVGVGNYGSVGASSVKRYFIGREHVFMDVGRWRYRVSADSFFQVNYTLWEPFLEEVLRKGGSYRKGLDLHCGVGFFTIPLSVQGNFIEGADANPSAIKDAEYNAKLNRRDNVVFTEATAYRYLKRRAGEIFDLVVLDPPRTGLLKEEVELLIKNKPARIVYISCNPTTLARDLKMLVRGGYELKGVKLIDNFPQTFHVESVSLLELSV
ncbi:MAG: 23S rRNA (uracil(1939)-C(5))-methyltransferase RlmD [Aquificae bacterium]|nr:23S rRNA (uracil(1939)-C(5))-methyltransferase RlmD [Aquificota bacterium]